MVYLQASIKLYPGKQQEFIELLNSLTPVLAKYGWKLVGSFATFAGRLNTKGLRIPRSESDPEKSRISDGETMAGTGSGSHSYWPQRTVHGITSVKRQRARSGDVPGAALWALQRWVRRWRILPLRQPTRTAAPCRCT